ncbi:hypothetical protein K2173_009151 [Erythroxylum novogranatense]|uniref:Uncharacterized protein n=1 Tax=Erythroxylum novogranatense TaxID=1862640 RepID=A0AAV8TKM9_9ROSI|nr:hypothetical protein K2173_009151 [Erythroxylum novogranatense]
MVSVITGEAIVGVTKDMAMIDSSTNFKEDIFGLWLVAQHPQRRIVRSKSSSISQEKTISNTITENRWRIEWLARWILVGLSKRISSVSGPVGSKGKGKKPMVVKRVKRSSSEKSQFQPEPVISRPLSESPMIVTRRKEALEVGQSSGPNVEGMVSNVSNQVLVVDSQVPHILSVEMPVLSVLDNVGDRVVAKFVSIKPKPPNPVAGDVIVGETTMVLSIALAPKVSCAVDDVVLSMTDDDTSDDHGDCGGCCRSQSLPKKL